MEDHLTDFSNFVTNLDKRVNSDKFETLTAWAVENLSNTLGFDCAWFGWVNLNQCSTEIYANSNFNLPANYHDAWEEMSDQDLLLDRLLADRNSTAAFDGGNEEPTEGMNALMETYHYNKVAVAMNQRQGRLGSFFLSTYRGGKCAKMWTEEEKGFLKCSVDQIARAVERSAAKTTNKEINGGVSIYVSKEGVGILGLRNLRDQLGKYWPSWQGDELPNRLKEILDKPGRYVLSDRNLIVTCEDAHNGRYAGLRKLRLRPLNCLDLLTERETEVARILATGKNHKETAVLLSIAPTTVRNHTQSIYGKLDVDNRVSLSALVQKHWG